MLRDLPKKCIVHRPYSYNKLEGRSKITGEFLAMMARGGSTVAEPSSLNPKIEGSDPASVTSREKMIYKNLLRRSHFFFSLSLSAISSKLVVDLNPQTYDSESIV